MMRSVLRAATAAGALAAVLLAAPHPARGDGEYLRVTPSTIQAGFQIEIEGYCGDNLNQATVKSDAFGTVTITPVPQPLTGKYLHRGTATIPTDKPARAYAVVMTCPSQQSATTTLNVVNYSVPSLGPNSGGGALADNSLPANGFTLAGIGALALGSLLLLLRRRKA
jgi:LPXTG-motif cell wall-anchored protein